MSNPSPAPNPGPVSTPQATFACYERDGGEVELVVRVTQGSKYRETRWNEAETPEIKRLFDEMQEAQGKL